MLMHMKKVAPWLLLALLLPFYATAGLPEFTRLVEKQGPAVVNVSTKQAQPPAQAMGRRRPQVPDGGQLEDFLRHFFGEGGPGPRQPMPDRRSLGSGFIISADGYILTNHHVVKDSDEIVIRLTDRREYVAELVGSDERTDIALLKIEAEDLPVVKIGNPRDVKVGEWVLAIGSPFGFENSVTAGIVSATGRSLPQDNYVPFIQTDVAINPGNSGGPLFDLDGNVIGINSQIYSRTGGFMGLSFAIPMDLAMDMVAQIKAQGYVERGWLGVLIQDVTRELASSFGMSQPRGALVAEVVPDSPAEAAGLRVGDIILEFADHEIIYSSDLPPLVGRTPVGSKRPLRILREGSKKTLTLEIAELPGDGSAAAPAKREPQHDRLGLIVEELDARLKNQLGVESGVLVGQLDEGAGRSAGILRGDVIVSINNQSVTSVEHYRELLEQLPAGDAVPVLVRRRGGPVFLALKVPEEG